MTSFYVYRRIEGQVVYDRSCGTKLAAEDRVSELKKRGVDSFFQTTPYPGAFY